MYSASKGAISAFIKCVALELAPKSIRVNAVCPAMVDTGILDSGTVSKEQLEEAREKFNEGKDKAIKEFNKRKDELVAKFKKEEN